MTTILGAISLLLIVGCSNIRTVPASLAATSLGVHNMYNYTDKTAANYYEKRFNEAPEAKKKQVRNEIIYELMALIDDEWEGFSRDLRADRSIKNVFVRVASIALTGFAPFSTGPIAKALAGIDTGLKGANEAIDAEAWGNQAPELLINTMRSERARLEELIYTSLEKDVVAYPLQSGMRDLVKYRNVGHVTHALTILAEQTAARAQEDKKNANAAKVDPAKAKSRLTQ